MTCLHWLGLCRKQPSFRALQTATGIPAEPAHEGLAGGGGGGPGTVRRGMGSALSAMRTLNRNRQLLWFTSLAGLVLAGNVVGQAAFFYFSYNLHMELDWIVWQFFIEFATLFCLVFLLAGLFLSVPLKKEGTVSFYEGLAGAKKYLKAIFLWALILVLAAMLLIIVLKYLPAWFQTPEVLFFYHNGFGYFDSFLFTTLSRFPFNLSCLPPYDIFTEIPGYGGRSVLLWFYPGLKEALIFSAINLALFVLTPFVVPLIVLGQKTLRDAAAGSCAMMKRIPVELAACAVFLGSIVFGVFLMYLLVDGTYMMVTPLATFYRPTDTWIALGLLYDLALFSVAFVVATVGGIAALNLYTSAKDQAVPGA